MIIGVDCRSLQEPQPSGVSVYTRELLSHLIRLPEAQQHEFVFFLNGRAMRKPRRLKQIQSGLEAPNVRWNVRTAPNKIITAMEVVWSRPSLPWMFGRVDTIFVPNMQFFPLLDRSVPFVLTVHDLSFVRYPECLSLRGRLRHHAVQPRTFVDRAAHLIAVSSHTKKDLEQLYGVDPSHVSVVHPGLSPLAVPDMQGRTPLPKKYFLCIATLEPRKNIDALLDAFAIVHERQRDLYLVIAGPTGWKSGALRKRIAEMPNVQYRGYVNEAEKQRLFSNALAFVYPSLYEGFGFPPLEAQQHGVPVLVGQHSALPEVLGNSALYCDVVDVDSLSRGIQHLVSDADLRTRLQQRGAENIKRWNWNITALNTLKVIETNA